MTQVEQSKKGLNKGLNFMNQGPPSGKPSRRSKSRPVEVVTRKGNRIYRHHYTREGLKPHAQSYVFRIKKSGTQHYFNLGEEIEKSKKLADQIHAFLSVSDNTMC